MTQRILIVGAGFAGLWSALGAVRVLDAAERDGSIEVAVIAPQPVLHLRPRLHEAAPHAMTAPLGELFDATGIRFVEGKVETIDVNARSVSAVDGRGRRFTLGYDRLVLATGSELNRPPIPGLAEHAFSIDQVADAAALETHLAQFTQATGIACAKHDHRRWGRVHRHRARVRVTAAFAGDIRQRFHEPGDSRRARGGNRP